MRSRDISALTSTLGTGKRSATVVYESHRSIEIHEEKLASIA